MEVVVEMVVVVVMVVVAGGGVVVLAGGGVGKVVVCGWGAEVVEVIMGSWWQRKAFGIQYDTVHMCCCTCCTCSFSGKVPILKCVCVAGLHENRCEFPSQGGINLHLVAPSLSTPSSARGTVAE